MIDYAATREHLMSLASLASLGLEVLRLVIMDLSPFQRLSDWSMRPVLEQS